MNNKNPSKPRPVGKIHFGPPDHEWPSEVQQLFKEAHSKERLLYMEAYNGPYKKESVDRLIELGTIICHQIETLWKKPDYRPFVEAASRQRNFFPLLHTNLIEVWFSCGDEMREKLPLEPAPGNEKGGKGRGKPGRKVLNDLLNREVGMFVQGVLKPGSLRVESSATEPDSPWKIVPFFNRGEIDLIDDATRQCLLSLTGRKSLGEWSQAFAEKYIHLYRPDLLSTDGEAGLFQNMVAERLSELQTKNPDEKSPWRAFKTLVTERLRKFKPMIESAIPTN
jgi:hypothetical protein